MLAAGPQTSGLESVGASNGKLGGLEYLEIADVVR